MRATDFLFDARKNPEQNPKVPPNQAIEKYMHGNREYRKIFVSFTTVPKLGINPQSKYNTPIGVYAYPGKYVYSKTGGRGSMSSLPFAGDSPYVNIFKSNGNLCYIDSLENDNELMGYYEDLSRVMSPFETGEMRGGYMHYNDYVKEFVRAAKTSAKIDSPGGHFWYVTMKCAEIVSKKKGIAKPLAWNWIFRKLEIDGVVDNGEGIIHENEPTQAVFFSMDKIEVLERVENKYNPERMSDQRYRGEHIKKSFEDKIRELRPILQSGNLDNLIAWLDEGVNNQYLRYVPAMLRPQVLSQRPFYISSLKEPTKNDLYAAFIASPGSMADYGERLLKLITMDDVIAILRKWNDIADNVDPTRQKTFTTNTMKYLMMYLGDSNVKRMDFLKEMIRVNSNLWEYIYDIYIGSISDMKDAYLDMVYNIAKQQSNQRVQKDVESLKSVLSTNPSYIQTKYQYESL